MFFFAHPATLASSMKQKAREKERKNEQTNETAESRKSRAQTKPRVGNKGRTKMLMCNKLNEQTILFLQWTP